MPSILHYLYMKCVVPGKLHARGNLDHSSLPVIMRVPVSPANAALATSILADRVNTDVGELEVPSLAGEGATILRLPLSPSLLLGLELRLFLGIPPSLRLDAFLP